MTDAAPRLRLKLPDFKRDFVQVPNTWARDTRLSRRARGLLVELISLPDGHEIAMGDLVEAGPEGRDALLTAVRELEKAGYLSRRRLADRYGMKAGYEWDIHAPEPVDNTTAENPLSGLSTAENPRSMTAENPRSYKTLNTPNSGSRDNHRGPVENAYRDRAAGALSALSENRVFLAETCQHVNAGSGRPCNGRILRDDPRWCQYGHRQEAHATG